MIGIDISEHNGYIDFSKLKETEVEFVILRVGWIGNKQNHTIDKYFEDYYQKAKANGFKIGIYVYNYCRSVATLDTGCQWIEKQLSGKQIDMPIFLDMEDVSISAIGKEKLTLQCKYFCDYFERRGYTTGIYANKFWFTNLLDTNQILNHKIWLAEWNSKITFKYKVDLWQYTNNGHFNGITGRVDTNKCMCNCEEKQEKNNENNEVYVNMKKYQNGSTIEPVYSDTALSHQIGFLNAHEICDCLGIQNNRPIVKYKVDNSLNYKIGFVNWLGGVSK